MDITKIRESYKLLDKGSYLTNAAVGAIHDDVYNASDKTWKLMREYGDIAEEEYMNIISTTINDVSSFLKIKSDDIALNANTSHNMNLIAMMLKQKNKKREIIIPSNEFPSSFIPFHHHGFHLNMIEPTQSVIDINKIIEQINDNTSAVVISAISFLTGFKIDLITLGQELDKRGVPFIVNATQMLGAFEIPFEEAKIKASSASVHKWYGAGFGLALFTTSEDFREGVKWPLAGWTSVLDPSKMSGTLPELRNDTSATQTGCIAFDRFSAVGEAARVIEKIGQKNISEKIIEVSTYLNHELENLPVLVNSYRDEVESCSGTLNLSFENKLIDVKELTTKLREENIYVNERKGFMRVSSHFYNTTEEIDQFISTLKKNI